MKNRDETTSVWTLPNRLSLVRILFIPAILVLISRQNEQLRFVSCILFIIAGITDGLDGLIARRMRMKTKLGVYLDPIADKLLISTVLIALSCYGLVPLWITIVMVSREFVINGLRSFYAGEGVTMYPSLAGKLKTTLQIVGIACVLFGPALYVPGLLVIYASLCFSLYSACRYIGAIFWPKGA